MRHSLDIISDGGKSMDKPPKDKECPFCHQAFTSSSLGRHLDLYIKDKNPKPPDGVHDVDAIRCLRGKITRRQPRQHPRLDSSATSSSKATPLPERMSPLSSRHPDDLNGEAMEPMKTFVNQPSWQATGVIKDLPPLRRPKSRDGHARPRPGSSQAGDDGDAVGRRAYLNAIDQSKAAELALKEVLESVKNANRLAFPPRPFEVNFFNLTLPQIYLQCLRPPPELLNEPPSWPHDLAWSIHPPRKEQYEAVRSWLGAKLSDWRRRHDRAQESLPRADCEDVDPRSPVRIDEVPKDHSMYYAHLERAFVKWFELSDHQRQEQWHFECAKAFARERELQQSTQAKLDYADLEVIKLHSRLERFSLEWSPDESPVPPATGFSLSREAVSYLPTTTDLDHHALIAKWRARLSSARAARESLLQTQQSHHYRGSLPSFSGTSHDSTMPDEVDDRDEHASMDVAGLELGKRSDLSQRTKEAKHTRRREDGLQEMEIG